jgi:hypothetical protein
VCVQRRGITENIFKGGVLLIFFRDILKKSINVVMVRVSG